MENEENVAFIVREFPMRLLPIEEKWRFGKRGLEGCGLTEEECKWGILEGLMVSMVQRFNMTEECNSIGFFVSKFEKTASYRGRKSCVCLEKIVIA